MIFVLSNLRCVAADAKVFSNSVITFISVPSISYSCCVYSAACKLMSGFLFFWVILYWSSSPVRYPEFYLSSCTDSFRGLMCCFGCAACGSGSCGVKGKSYCLMYKPLTTGSIAVSNKYCWRQNQRPWCFILCPLFWWVWQWVDWVSFQAPLSSDAASLDPLPASALPPCEQGKSP